MSTITDDSEIRGRKVFFLHPSATVQNHIVTELAQQEFEVYVIKDHKALWRLLRKYTNSVVFADIDEGMHGAEWEKWTRDVKETLPDVAIGIISTNKDEDLKNKYINSVKVHCGFTVMKSDINKVIAEILEHLKTVNAKGRRKYIRVTMEHETTATVNLPLNGAFINGVIRDISVVGISCSLATDQILPKNSFFKDVQIKLQSMLLNVEVIVFGCRIDGDSKIYVLLFTQRIDPEAKTKIRRYIQQNLQRKMEIELK